MKIISLIRKPDGVSPTIYILGQKPRLDKDLIEEESPIVSAIKYWHSSPAYVRVHNGPVYVVEFAESTVRRIFPVNHVLDIAVETVKEDPEKLPGLPVLEKKGE